MGKSIVLEIETSSRVENELGRRDDRVESEHNKASMRVVTCKLELIRDASPIVSAV